jgi:ABC-2 type transport system permease protein
MNNPTATRHIHPELRSFTGRIYARVFTLGLQQQMEYRFNTLLESLIGLGSFLVLFFLWTSVYASNGGATMEGMSLPQMLTYVLLSKFWDWVQNPGAEIDEAIPEDIRGGGLSKVLTRPMSDRFYRLSLYLSRRAFCGALRAPLIAAVMCILPGLFSFSLRSEHAMLPLVLLLSLLLQFTFSYAVALAAFWFQAIGGLLFLKRITVSFLAGAWIPLMLLPLPVREASEMLPFQYMVYFPVRVAQGGMPMDRIMAGCLIMGGWIIALWAMGALLWKRGLRQYSAAGI